MDAATVDLNTVLRRDRYRFGKALRKHRRVAPDSDLHRKILNSQALVNARRAGLERLSIDLHADLPLSEHADEIRAALAKHNVVIVAGETGSGKTTQLPKLLLERGLGVSGMIGHTQPRRIAARSVAQRIAQETATTLGREIGYAVRFTDRVGEDTLVKVMTDGLLLAEVRNDRFLEQYDAIIVDEAHERSLNIDFLLGYLKRLLERRKDLKVIVTSATIDVERFAEFFGGAPTVKVGGRTYPVTVHYEEAGATPDALERIVEIVDEIDSYKTSATAHARDILVFFSGERDILEASRELRRHFANRLDILPLYARLSTREQQKIFATSSARRRVVLATNVAETSLTVPNIGFVIDPGFARVNRYSYRSKLQRLPIEPISQASAEQRKGRCGRIAPGVCFRLYSEQDFQSRPPFTDPEIRRVNLAGVLLQMLSLRLGRIETFAFLDPPDPRAVKDARLLLTELGATDAGRLTPTGRMIARLPVDPRLGRMLVEAHAQNAVKELLVIAAGLAIMDPRERPLQHAQAADLKHARFADERSDFASYLKLWQWLETERQDSTRRVFERTLRKSFINPQRVREWRETHRQLRLICRELGFVERAEDASYQRVHEAVIAGSLSLLARHDERGQYLGARNLRLRIFPGSGLARRTPRWLIAGEIVETQRVYARSAAQIEARWIEQHATHLVKRQYSEPTWSVERGETIAFETVTLYGLTLAERRPISYRKLDAVVSRELFLREGLVHGHIKDKEMPQFLRQNLLTIAEIRDVEAKGRRRDVLVDDDHILAFYAKQVPSDIDRVKDLSRWVVKASPEQQAALRLSVALLTRDDAFHVTADEFPSVLEIDALALPLKYRFAPGERDDGVTVIVPSGVIAGVGAEPLEWLVPGFFTQLIEQWLRALPKNKRRALAPVADKVADIATTLSVPDVYRRGRLLTALSRVLEERYGVVTDVNDWDRERIDAHLKIFVRVVDDQGKTLASGRDIRQIKSGFETNRGTSAIGADFERDGLKGFPGDLNLAEQLIVGQGERAQLRYPGFVDRGQAVDLRLFVKPAERDVSHAAGLARLAWIHLGQAGKYFRRELDKHPRLELQFATLGSRDELKDTLLLGAIWYCFFDEQPIVTDAAAFAERIETKRGELASVFDQTVSLYAQVIERRFAIKRQLEALTSKAYAPSKLDIEAHLDAVASKTLLKDMPLRFLSLAPRYLDGISRRLEQLPGHVPKDRQHMAAVARYQERLRAMEQAELFDKDRFVVLRTLLEELRLKLFAENIATQKVADHPLVSTLGSTWRVSEKRVDQALLEEERRLGLG